MTVKHNTILTDSEKGNTIGVTAGESYVFSLTNVTGEVNLQYEDANGWHTINEAPVTEDWADVVCPPTGRIRFLSDTGGEILNLSLKRR